MRRELQIQTDIVTSVRRDGGYARKVSNRFQIGLPDLVISMPTYAPCFAEVKDFGEIKGEFDRAIGITPKQALELDKIAKSQIPPIAMLLIGFSIYKKHYLLYLPASTRRVSSSIVKGVTAPVIQREKGGYYNLKAVLERLGIARIEGARAV